MTDADRITIHSSWRRVLTSYFGAGLLTVVGSVAVASNGFSLLPVAILVGGMVLLIGVIFDYPIASTFDADGVTRRALVRRHRIEWDAVDQLTRTRPSVFSLSRRVVQGGLTAAIGRRRYLLTDAVESLTEHEELESILDGNELAFDRLLRPPDDVAPTWLYRRSKWRPDTDA